VSRWTRTRSRTPSRRIRTRRFWRSCMPKLHRCTIGCQVAGGACTSTQRPRDRGRDYLARRACHSRLMNGTSMPSTPVRQKCLSCPPGLSPISFSERAVGKDQDAQDQGGKLVPRPHTGDGLLGRRRQTHLPPHRTGECALRSARGAGDAAGRRLENSWARHEHHHRALRTGLENLGFDTSAKTVPVCRNSMP